MKRKPTYICFDCETGGVSTDTSLLSFYGVVLDQEFRELDELYLFLKPDDHIYHVTAEALDLNKIDLKMHDLIAVSYLQGRDNLSCFLRKNQPSKSEKLIPIGHNIHFDITHVTEKLISLKNWESFVSYRVLDTQIIARFLALTGKIDKSQTKFSLSALVDYFGLTPKDVGYKTSVAHDAKFDTKMTVEVLKRLIKL